MERFEVEMERSRSLVPVPPQSELDLEEKKSAVKGRV